MNAKVRLTHEQDGVLRRLTFFERVGAVLAPPLRTEKAALRSLDARQVVREPWESRVAERA